MKLRFSISADSLSAPVVHCYINRVSSRAKLESQLAHKVQGGVYQE